MIRTILGTGALAVALSAGPALADCQTDIQQFNENYADFLEEEIRSNIELQPVLQNLRDAAMLLHTHGNDEGCEAVLGALVYLVDDYHRKSAQEPEQAPETGTQTGQQPEQAAAQKPQDQPQEAEMQAGQEADKPDQQEGQQAQHDPETRQEAEQPAAQTQQGQTQAAQAEAGQQVGEPDQQAQRDPETRQEAEQPAAQTQQDQTQTAQPEAGQQAMTPDEPAEASGVAGEAGFAPEVTADERAQAIAARTVPFVDMKMPVDTAELLDRPLRNFDDTALGEVDGVLVSTDAGLTHLIVVHGGFLGIGERQIAIPVKQLRWDPKEEAFYVDVTDEQIGNAPEYEPNSDEWVAEVNDRWYDDPS